MSTTTTYLVRNIGAAWQAAVYDWESFVMDTTKTFAISMTNTAPFRAIVTATTVAGDVTTKIYAICELQNGAPMPVHAYLLSPGMRTMPRVLAAAYGARVPLTEWRATMVPFRRVTMTSALGIQARSLRQESDDHDPIDWDSHSDFWVVRSNGMVGIDSLLITIYQAAFSVVLPGNEGLSDGLIGGPQLSAPGHQADLSPLVTAVQDIARRDVTISIDNGDTLVHLSGAELET